jgi:hypothetical protein
MAFDILAHLRALPLRIPPRDKSLWKPIRKMPFGIFRMSTLKMVLETRSISNLLLLFKNHPKKPWLFEDPGRKEVGVREKP